MADKIPSVSVTLNQVTNTSNTVNIPFIATVICKCPTGPIGELTQVDTYSNCVKIFGQGTAATPALYGVEQYLKTYNYVNIIRVASNSAAKGTVSISSFDANGDAVEGLNNIISGITDYKTDLYNGDTINLVYNAARTKLYITADLDGVTYTTPKSTIDLSTATADLVEPVINGLVNYWNALSTGITLTNNFINKTATDVSIAPTYTSHGTVSTGDSGNDNTITDNDVIALFDLIEEPTVRTQDVVTAPEFRGYNVVNAGTSLKNSYFYIVAAQGSGIDAKQTSIENYEPSDKGVLYIPDGCKMADQSITVPFEIAALYAWATTYNTNRYYAPAGVKRGVLSLVSSIVNNVSEDDAVEMYNAKIPANPVKYITNYGYVLFGQKTMDAEQQFTNRINVANLVNYILITGKELLQPYLFEYTPISTFQKVYLDLDKLMSNLATQEIVYDDYKIVCDTSNNTAETLAKHELHASIAVRPINVIEYIFLDLTVTDEIGEDE